MPGDTAPGYTLKPMNNYQLKRRLEIVINDFEMELKREADVTGRRRQERLRDTHEYLLRAWHALDGSARQEEPTSQD